MTFEAPPNTAAVATDFLFRTDTGSDAGAYQSEKMDLLVLIDKTMKPYSPKTIQNNTFLKENARVNRSSLAHSLQSCGKDSTLAPLPAGASFEGAARDGRTTFTLGQRVYVEKAGRWGNVVGDQVARGIETYWVRLSSGRNCPSEIVAVTSAELEAA